MRKDGIQKTRRGIDFTHEAEFIYNNRKEGRQDAGRVVNKAWEIIKFLFSVKQKPDKSAENEEEGRFWRFWEPNNGPGEWKGKWTREI